MTQTIISNCALSKTNGQLPLLNLVDTAVGGARRLPLIAVSVWYKRKNTFIKCAVGINGKAVRTYTSEYKAQNRLRITF